jgi:hypothetical protein
MTREIGEVLKSWARFGLVPGARSDVEADAPYFRRDGPAE